MEDLVNCEDEKLSFDACVCLGKLKSVKSKCAIESLLKVIEKSHDWNKKSIALEILVRQFELKSRDTLLFILNQIENSPIWISRMAAFKLLAFLGNI